jgi:hypothetical protein
LELRITLDIIKVSSNAIYAGTHWTKRKKLKEDYLWLTKKFQHLTPIHEKVDLDFKFYFKSHPLDSSNCFFLVKMIEDCLVTYGVLKGDSIQYVRKVSVESGKDKAKDHCILTIIPVDNKV